MSGGAASAFWVPVRLGLRLTRAGRGATGRLTLTAVGVGIGVALLLGVAGIGPAVVARNARTAGQQPVGAAPVAGSIPRPALLVWSVYGDSFRGQPLDRVLVATPSPSRRIRPPAGVNRLPGAGQLVVSPALSRLLHSPEGALVRPRLPGRVVGIVRDAGLAYPGQLLAYVGVPPPPPSTAGQWEPASGFAPPVASPASTGSVDWPLRLFIVLATVVLLTPVVAFTAAATRLSAASRDRRLAALRLLGATPGQTRLLAAVDAGVAASVGSLLGVGGFLTGRQALPALLPSSLAVFPSTLAPPVTLTVAILAGVPLLAAGVGVLALRRVELSPLGVRRQARVRRPGPIRSVPLIAGLAGLGVLAGQRKMLLHPSPSVIPEVAVAGCGLLILVGVLLAGPWLGLALAGPLARRTRSAGALLGARQLQLDPTASVRVVSGVVAVAFAAALVLELAPVYDRFPLTPAGSTRPGMLVASGRITPHLVHTLDALTGVRAVVPVWHLLAEGTGVSAPTEVVIADCPGVARLFGSTVPRCQPGTAFYAPGPAGLSAYADRTLRPFTLPGAPPGAPGLKPFPPFHLPSRLQPAAFLVNAVELAELWMPLSALPPTVRAHLPAPEMALLGTDGGWRTRQQVRNAVALGAPASSVQTPAQLGAGLAGVRREIGRAVAIGVLLTELFATAGLLITAWGSVIERRRTIAVLTASGVPARALSIALVTATGLPLVGGVAVAVGAALGAGALFQYLTFTTVHPVWTPVAAASVGALLSVAVVTAACLPTLTGAHRIGSLRSE